MSAGITLPYRMIQPPSGFRAAPPSRAVTASPVMIDPNRVTSWPVLRDTMTQDVGQNPPKTTGGGRSLRCQQKQKLEALGKPHSKRASVWTQFGLSVPSGRSGIKETLEKDREYQRSCFDPKYARDLASPARSHAASIFFPRVADAEGAVGTSGADFFAPGAFRRVARPQTKEMERLPNTVSSIRVVTACNAYGLSALASMASMPTSPQGRKDELEKLAGVLPTETDVFTNQDCEILKAVIDSYAKLTYPPEEETPATPQSSLKRASVSGLLGGSQSDKDPYILRSGFCRMLLASELCTGGGGYRYHKCVTMFDKHATPLGNFSAMPRSLTVRIFCQLLEVHEEERAEKERMEKERLEKEYALLHPPSTAEREQSGLRLNSSLLGGLKPHTPSKTHQLGHEEEERPAYVRHFIESALPAADQHCSCRRYILDCLVAETSPLERLELPASVLDDVSESEIWPPLPPRSVDMKDLPNYMKGVREWQENLKEQSPQQLLALRAHTEGVLQREILASQLLEPEVLHFAERFQPLFNRIFCAYADRFAPAEWLEESQPVARKRQSVVELNDGVEHSEKLNHMSFSAFFQFCVDFGLFPTHASLQEIRLIYTTAEAVRRAAEPKAPPPEEEAVLHPEPHSRGRSKSLSKSKNSHGAEGKVVNKAHVAAQLRIKKACEAAAAEALANAVAAEAALPRANLEIFDKPPLSMTKLEFRTLVFFGAINQWLEDGYLRLPELFEDPFSIKPQESSCASRRPSHSGISTPGSVHSAHAHQPPRSLEAATAAAVEAALATVPKMTLVNASQLLEALAPLALINCPTQDEIEKMYGLVILKSGSASQAEHPSELPLFELDRLVQKAGEKLDAAWIDSCLLLSAPQHSCATWEGACVNVLRCMDDRYFQESRMGMGTGDFFENVEDVTPNMALTIAKEQGADEEKLPDKKTLGSMFATLGSSRSSGALGKDQAYRALALVQCTRRQERRAHRRTQMSYVAKPKSDEQCEVCFGLGAFLECLLKIAFHRLGGKGSNEIQRGAPSWWKCAWLLTVFGSAFAERAKLLQYEELVTSRAAKGTETVFEAEPQARRRGRVNIAPEERLGVYIPSEVASIEDAPAPAITAPTLPAPPSPSARATKLEEWWHRIHLETLPRYMPAMELLVRQAPNLFDPVCAESSTCMVAATPQGRALCRQCGERRSPSGWGSPGCLACGGVDELCLPINGHLFAGLLFTDVPSVVMQDVIAEEGEEESVLQDQPVENNPFGV